MELTPVLSKREKMFRNEAAILPNKNKSNNAMRWRQHEWPYGESRWRQKCFKFYIRLCAASNAWWYSIYITGPGTASTTLWVNAKFYHNNRERSCMHIHHEDKFHTHKKRVTISVLQVASFSWFVLAKFCTHPQSHFRCPWLPHVQYFQGSKICDNMWPAIVGTGQQCKL